MMKSIMKGILRDERGNVLILVLILLVVGGLILTPLLGLMSTGLLAGKVYERKMDDYYAADAGVEDAIWRIKNDPPNSYPYEYPEPLTVNDRSVDVVVYREDLDPTCAENLTYRILSIATTDDGGGIAAIDSSTTIDAHLSVSYLDLSALLDNAIVSQYTIDIQPGTEINGDIWLPDEDDLEEPPHWSHNGTVKDEDDGSIVWPTAEQLSGYYWDDVKHLEEEAYPDGYVMNIPGGTSEGDPYVIGPLLAEGDLTIKGDGWIRLEGTIYIKGNLNFNPTPAINIDLNKQTIFAEGEILINPGVALYGSGCIIAIGYIDFQPSIASEGDEFVLVMSITDVVWFHPNGDFTGCIAGDAHVELSPGGTISWISPESKGLDFPMGVGDDDELPPVTGLKILSWEIS
jgi:hypothetical protein